MTKSETPLKYNRHPETREDGYLIGLIACAISGAVMGFLICLAVS